MAVKFLAVLQTVRLHWSVAWHAHFTCVISLYNLHVRKGRLPSDNLAQWFPVSHQHVHFWHGLLFVFPRSHCLHLGNKQQTESSAMTRSFFSARIHWGQMSWIWGKEGNIKWPALASLFLRPSWSCDKAVSSTQMTLFFSFKIMPYKVKDLFKWITLSLLSRFHVLKDTTQPIWDFYGWRFLFAGLWMFSCHSTFRTFFKM